MPPEERDTHTVREWLEEAWRHGEVVAEQEASLNGAAPRRHTRARRLAQQVQRALRVIRAVLRAARRG
jgi:hypothetical protein